MTYSVRIRLQTKNKIGSKLSDFFPSKFSFYFLPNPKKLQASSIGVLHRQRASKNTNEEYMWCGDLTDKHYAVSWMMMLL